MQGKWLSMTKSSRSLTPWRGREEREMGTFCTFLVLWLNYCDQICVDEMIWGRPPHEAIWRFSRFSMNWWWCILLTTWVLQVVHRKAPPPLLASFGSKSETFQELEEWAWWWKWLMQWHGGCDGIISSPRHQMSLQCYCFCAIHLRETWKFSIVYYRQEHVCPASQQNLCLLLLRS